MLSNKRVKKYYLSLRNTYIHGWHIYAYNYTEKRRIMWYILWYRQYHGDSVMHFTVNSDLTCSSCDRGGWMHAMDLANNGYSQSY